VRAGYRKGGQSDGDYVNCFGNLPVHDEFTPVKCLMNERFPPAIYSSGNKTMPPSVSTSAWIAN
jgi:hypothetical protein